MTLAIGSVTVDPDDASYVGSGLTLAIFEAKKPALDDAAAEQVSSAGDMLEKAEEALEDAETALAEIEANYAGDNDYYGAGYADIHGAAEDRVDTAQENLDRIEASNDLVARKVALYIATIGDAHELASALVPYLTANAVVTVTIPTSGAGAGLQRTPDPNDPNTATLAPPTPKTIGGVLT